MIPLQDYSLVTIVIAGLAAIMIASECGIWLGTYASYRGYPSVGSTLESAILGLLALMIGFTFAIALSRFDARRDAILIEANTIGTAALRARMLPAPRDAQALTLLRDYARVRLDITRDVPAPAALSAAIARSNDIQEHLWQQAIEIARTDSRMVPVGLYIQSLNQMIDAQGRRLAATNNRVPNSVIVGLYLIAIIAGGFSGYGMGLDAQRNRVRICIMAAVVSGVILLLLDLDRPNIGFIAVSQQPLIDTAQSLALYLK